MNAATSATMMSGDLPKVIGGVPTGLFIAGQWRSAASGRTMPVENPATREILAHVADADPADAQAAVAAAAVAHRVGGDRAPDAVGHSAAGLRADHCPRGGPRHRHARGAGPAAGRSPRRSRLR